MNRDDYLKNAEVAMEATYNHIDGVLGNDPPRNADMDLTDGQTHEEMKELAPETLPDERLSILRQLIENQKLVLEEMQRLNEMLNREDDAADWPGVPRDARGR